MISLLLGNGWHGPNSPRMPKDDEILLELDAIKGLKMFGVDEALVDGRRRNCLLTVMKRHNKAPIESLRNGKSVLCISQTRTSRSNGLQHEGVVERTE